MSDERQEGGGNYEAIAFRGDEGKFKFRCLLVYPGGPEDHEVHVQARLTISKEDLLPEFTTRIANLSAGEPLKLSLSGLCPIVDENGPEERMLTTEEFRQRRRLDDLKRVIVVGDINAIIN